MVIRISSFFWKGYSLHFRSNSCITYCVCLGVCVCVFVFVLGHAHTHTHFVLRFCSSFFDTIISFCTLSFRRRRVLRTSLFWWAKPKKSVCKWSSALERRSQICIPLHIRGRKCEGSEFSTHQNFQNLRNRF